jgi:DNA-binding cell septation regulator SpoVG
MSNISIKINLRQLKSAVRTMKSASGDIECLIIPIDQNHLVKGEKGLYLDMQAYELKEKKADRKDTHLIKQGFTKEVFDAMTDEEKKTTPILGNLIVWGYQEPAPVNVEIADTQQGEGDDLPF